MYILQSSSTKSIKQKPLDLYIYTDNMYKKHQLNKHTYCNVNVLHDKHNNIVSFTKHKYLDDHLQHNTLPDVITDNFQIQLWPLYLCEEYCDYTNLNLLIIK